MRAYGRKLCAVQAKMEKSDARLRSILGSDVDVAATSHQALRRRPIAV